jgi:hypothetical protein
MFLILKFKLRLKYHTIFRTKSTFDEDGLKKGTKQLDELSISQKYMLLAVTRSGSFPLFNLVVPVCFLCGAILELLEAKCLIINNNTLKVIDALPDELASLNSFYTWVKTTQVPATITEIGAQYIFSSKKMKVLFDDVGSALSEKGCMFASQLGYVPALDCVQAVVKGVEREFLFTANVTADALAIVSLLEQSNLLKKRLPVESHKTLKKKLKTIRKSKDNPELQMMVKNIETIEYLISQGMI